MTNTCAVHVLLYTNVFFSNMMRKETVTIFNSTQIDHLFCVTYIFCTDDRISRSCLWSYDILWSTTPSTPQGRDAEELRVCCSLVVNVHLLWGTVEIMGRRTLCAPSFSIYSWGVATSSLRKVVGIGHTFF